MTIAKLIASICIIASSLSISTNSLATERSHTSTLKAVYPLASGDFVLLFDVDAALCTATNSPKYMYVSVGQNGVTSAGSSKLYAAALLALSTRQTLSMAFDDSTTYCYISRYTIG